MPPQTNPRDPWRKAPVGELGDQLLPRWFVLLCVALVPVAIAAAVAAFIVFSPADVPVAERRPPPSEEGLTNDVGDYNVGAAPPVAYSGACPMLDGVQIAGEEADLAVLRLGLAALCNASLPPVISDRLAAFAAEGGIVRFAQFESTGVDSTALLTEQPPVILVNARFLRSDPLWIAPVVAHDTTFVNVDPSTAEGALEARRAEDLVCDRVLAGRRASRGCADAQGLLGLDDPLAALREAGFR